ncbi:MAG: hypothetical protein ACD_3C00105G0011 [uncultured bacterium (gcode 4)]|uniref:Aminoglycoside phosphotransferase domain-containing protein n=1 Tax=uncultured bacterium (gcode 4) TaxID=1234023 RepID=K2FYR3_9BACT|nr:MAG: hypothetical protein ACD_3C00105G0011 [uncultured bacterium (gcode 4)]
MKKNINVAYFSIDYLRYEWFRSGALVWVREMLKELSKDSYETFIFSVAHKSNLTPKDAFHFNDKPTLYWNTKIYELDIWENYEVESLRKIIIKIIYDFDLDLILLESPSVELRRFDLDFLKLAVENSSRTIIMIQDELFPDYTLWRDTDLVWEYISHMRNISAICPTLKHRNLIYKSIWVKSEVINNIFDIDSISVGPKKWEYITLINPIPLKWIKIFEEVAKSMPDEKFLAIEGWRQEKSYVSNFDNLQVWDFVQDQKLIYENTKILLVPSLIKEGWPRVIVEALCNNIPVIAHDIWWISDVGNWCISLLPRPKDLLWSVVDPYLSQEDLLCQANLFIEEINKIKRNASNLADTKEVFHSIHNRSLLQLKAFFSWVKNDLFENRLKFLEIKDILSDSSMENDALQVRLLAKWNRNNIFLISDWKQKYVCRENIFNSKSENIDIVKNEKNILETISELDMSPKIICQKNEWKYLLIDYLDWNQFDMLSTELIISLAISLGKLHDYKAFQFPWQYFWIEDKEEYDNTTILLEHYWAAKQILIKLWYAEEHNILLLMEMICEKLKNHIKSLNWKNDNNYVICHWDLKKENIVFCFWVAKFIDWEASHPDIREVDIAKIFSTFNFTPAKETLFLDNYWYSGTGIFFKRLRLFRKIFEFYELALKHRYSYWADESSFENELLSFYEKI